MDYTINEISEYIKDIQGDYYTIQEFEKILNQNFRPYKFKSEVVKENIFILKRDEVTLLNFKAYGKENIYHAFEVI